MAFLPADNKAGKLIGNYLTNAIGSTLPLLYSWVAANYAGHTKKVRFLPMPHSTLPFANVLILQVTMNAILLMSFCIGNIIGPLTFTAPSAPNYIPAKIAIIVTCAVAAILSIILQVYYIWENKRRDRLADAGEVGHLKDVEFADVTDRSNKEFRYRL